MFACLFDLMPTTAVHFKYTAKLIIINHRSCTRKHANFIQLDFMQTFTLNSTQAHNRHNQSNAIYASHEQMIDCIVKQKNIIVQLGAECAQARKLIYYLFKRT